MKYKNMIVCTENNEPLAPEDIKALEEFQAFRVMRNKTKNNKSAWELVEEYRKNHNGELPPLPTNPT